jgi:hypothetical protein
MKILSIGKAECETKVHCVDTRHGICADFAEF